MLTSRQRATKQNILDWVYKKWNSFGTEMKFKIWKEIYGKTEPDKVDQNTKLDITVQIEHENKTSLETGNRVSQYIEI